ncbi:glutathionylspermidine synthase family protein [Ectobacillus funiculus]|uniref:glutathionylspermidine synthase family protein n=1 Tax=Ectobacillus funiculus TaxID=137993 RepID=UPI00397B8AF5
MSDRTSFYNTIHDFWPDLYGQPYALYDVLLISKEKTERLREASTRASHIFFKVASLLRRLDEETLLAMYYPKEALPFLRLTSSLSESIIARLDFVESNEGFKVMELNADTPTFIKELFSVNKQVCAHFRCADVNEGEEYKLQMAVQEAVDISAGRDDAYIVFTAHEDNDEDRLTILYLQQLYGKASRFVPLDKLQIIPHEGLYDEKGKKIDVLYRQTFPIESLLLDYDEAGAPIGQMLLSLVCAGKLKVINPPSAFLLQNKAVQAVIWGLHEERNSFFSDEEHEWIANHFLPTYLEEDTFLMKRLPYVKKPIFGREGDTVELYDGKGSKTLEETQKSYEAYGFVYQQYVDLPALQIDVNGQKQDGHMMYGSFLLNGRASSIGCRVGGKITNNVAYYLPLGIQKDEG